MKNNNEKKELLGNSFQQFISTLIELFGGLIFTIILARVLQPELFGVYSLALTITLFLMAFSNMGINEALLRYISLNSSKKRLPKASSYFLYLTKLKLYVLIFFSLILLVFAKPLSIFYNNPQLFLILIFSSFYLFLFSFLRFFSSLFFAFKKVKYFTFTNLIFHLSKLLFIPIILLIPVSLKIETVFLILSFSSLLSILYMFLIVAKNYKFLVKRSIEVSKEEKKVLYHYLKYLWIGSLSSIILMYLDILMLGYFVKATYIGLYRVAFSLVSSAGALLSFSGVFYSIFTSYENEKLENAFNRVFYAISILALPMSLGLSLISKPFIVFLFGYSYIEAYFPLIALSFFIFISTIGDLFLTLFNSKGKSKITAYSIFISTLFNIVLNLILISYFLGFGEIYTTIGASIASVVSRLALVIVLLKYTKKEINIHVDFMRLKKPIISSLIMVLYLFTFNKIFYGNLNLYLGIVEVTFAILIYFAVLYLLKGIKKEDWVLFLSVFKRFQK